MKFPEQAGARVVYVDTLKFSTELYQIGAESSFPDGAIVKSVKENAISLVLHMATALSHGLGGDVANKVRLNHLESSLKNLNTISSLLPVMAIGKVISVALETKLQRTIRYLVEEVEDLLIVYGPSAPEEPTNSPYGEKKEPDNGPFGESD